MQSRISFVGCSCCRWVYDWGVPTRPCCAHRALPSFIGQAGKKGQVKAFVSFSNVQPPWHQCQQLPYKNLCIYMQIHTYIFCCTLHVLIFVLAEQDDSRVPTICTVTITERAGCEFLTHRLSVRADAEEICVGEREKERGREGGGGGREGGRGEGWEGERERERESIQPPGIKFSYSEYLL